MRNSGPKKPVGPLARSGGFSLIEVLVSIIVLSFGMLGMVGLQAAALQANREARYQSAAVTLARELAEMMRGNKAIGIKTTANPYLGTFTSPLTAGSPSYCLNAGVATPCSDSTAIANAQMTEWLQRLDVELPGARVTVCFDDSPFDGAGMPQWGCSTSGSNAVVKIGWTRASTHRAATSAAAFERATVPSVVLPVTPGNSL